MPTPEPRIAPVMVKAERNGATSAPFTVTGFTVKVREAEPRLRPPAMVLEVVTFEELAEMSPVRVRRPPMLPLAFKVGAAPPLLLKMKPASELAPIRFKVPPPLRVTTLLAAIWPETLFIVTVAPLMVRPPPVSTVVALVALRLRVP